MTTLKEKLRETVDYLTGQVTTRPHVGIILGTGLGALAREIQTEKTVSYLDIPHFPVSTVETHAGNLMFGRLAGKTVVAMQGRFHLYEGYSLEQITFPVRVLKALGCTVLVVSNACGGLNPSLAKGSIMAITDHINLLGTNPLIGPNDDSLGPRFPDMSQPYDRDLTELARAAARKLDLELPVGVYACLSGPSLETRAEYRFLQVIGADVVGMSTVPEVIVAVHSGLRVLGLSVITDLCHPETLKPTNIDEIIRVASQAEPKLVALIKNVVEKL